MGSAGGDTAAVAVPLQGGAAEGRSLRAYLNSWISACKPQLFLNVNCKNYDICFKKSCVLCTCYNSFLVSFNSRKSLSRAVLATQKRAKKPSCPCTTESASEIPNYPALFLWLCGFGSLESPLPFCRRLTSLQKAEVFEGTCAAPSTSLHKW